MEVRNLKQKSITPPNLKQPISHQKAAGLKITQDTRTSRMAIRRSLLKNMLGHLKNSMGDAYMVFLLHSFAHSISKLLVKNSSKNHFVLYKIVDSTLDSNNLTYSVQCINTKALFPATLADIIFDLDILHGLHPIQGCYIGIEYAKLTQSEHSLSHFQIQNEHTMTRRNTSCRYGSYELLYQNRNGLLGFEHKQNGKQFLMDPIDIALSKELIEEFDVIQAFFIGITAGFKLLNKKDTPKTPKRTHLRLITQDEINEHL